MTAGTHLSFRRTIIILLSTTIIQRTGSRVHDVVYIITVSSSGDNKVHGLTTVIRYLSIADTSSQQVMRQHAGS